MRVSRRRGAGLGVEPVFVEDPVPWCNLPEG